MPDCLRKVYIGIIRAVPQLARLLRARQAYGVSLDSAATSSVVSFGWAAYGLLTGQIFVSLATGSSGFIFALIALFAVRFGRSIKEIKVAPFWAVVLVGSGVLFGKQGLGIMLPVSVLAANIPQLWVAYREGNLTDLSLGAWALSISDGLVWGIYSLIQQDFSIMVFALFQLTTSGLIVLLKLLHGAKLRHASPA
ncbi:MAG: hypothetical protein IPM07_19785 [Anaerolineales bacterium]|nr:hypothetical protein [Anaerolineales bacterium]